MKPQYFTDQRDYFKQSIIRHLLERDFSCTICWMFTPDDGGQAGQVRDYLDDPNNWRPRDPVVFDFLRAQNMNERPDLRSTEDPAISPIARCRFHWPEFPAVLEDRLDYFHAAIQRAADSDFIFIDPDTGPAPPRMKANELTPSHISPAEIAHVHGHGFSVLVLHFLQRNLKRRARQVTNTRQRLEADAPTAVVRALRTDDLAFYFVLQQNHDHRAQLAINDIITAWQGPLLRTPP